MINNILGAGADDGYDSLLESIYKVPTEVKNDNPLATTPYKLLSVNWYKTIPYCFRVRIPNTANVIGFSSPVTITTQPAYFFPVNPESVSIDTPFATSVTPTIGGIIEEHSGPIFYNIRLSGTTGVTPGINLLTGKPRSTKNETRNSAFDQGLLPASLGGFGASTLSVINSAVSAFTGIGDKMLDGARNETSGYTAYHILYKFLWLYHFSKANGFKGKLLFVNVKDNNQYEVVVENFQLVRDKSEPHLYRYNIAMKGWKLKTLSENPIPEESAISMANRMRDLGLGETTSIKALIHRTLSIARSTLNAANNLVSAVAQDVSF